jgi:hypothetical protein
MANKYIIDLTAAEHEELCRLLKQGKSVLCQKGLPLRHERFAASP